MLLDEVSVAVGITEPVDAITILGVHKGECPAVEHEPLAARYHGFLPFVQRVERFEQIDIFGPDTILPEDIPVVICPIPPKKNKTK